MGMPARKRREGPEDRELLQRALLQLSIGRHSTPTLARALRVSPATAFRVVKRLRAGGVRIVSVKEGRSWTFEVRDQLEAAWASDPLLEALGSVKGRRRPGESVDDVVYGRRRRAP
jgi:biotin operon repressor